MESKSNDCISLHSWQRGQFQAIVHEQDRDTESCHKYAQTVGDTQRHQEVQRFQNLMHKNVIVHTTCNLDATSGATGVLYREESMATRLNAENGISLNLVIKWSRDIADAMDYLHNRKIIHRDLKAENILVTEDDEIRVYGFGLSRDELFAREDIELNDATFRHMAPELMKKEISSNKVDVWSFGVVLWRMILRLVPYKEFPSLQEVVCNVGNRAIRPALPTGLPEQIFNLLERCFNRCNQERPSFSDVMDAVDDIYAAVTVSETVWQAFVRECREALANSTYEVAPTTNEQPEMLENEIKCDYDTAHLEATTSQHEERCARCSSIHPKNSEWCNLHDAVEHNDLAGVLAYLEHPEVDFFLEQIRLSRTPLMRAAERGFDKVVALLLDAGANTGLIGGEAAIHRATCSNQESVVRLFVMQVDENDHERRALVINMRDREEWTPLHWASRYRAVDVARFLLDQGADQTLMTKGGQAPIHMACRANCVELVELFLARGATPNMRGFGGWTPLHHAAISGAKDVVRLLLAVGADYNLLTEEKEKAIDLARSLDQEDVIDILVGHKYESALTGIADSSPSNNEATITQPTIPDQALRDAKAVQNCNPSASSPVLSFKTEDASFSEENSSFSRVDNGSKSVKQQDYRNVQARNPLKQDAMSLHCIRS